MANIKAQDVVNKMHDFVLSPEQQEELETLLKHHSGTNNSKKMITDAYKFAIIAHEGVFRDSGDPYIVHPVGVAKILDNIMHADYETICAGLLHDTIEDVKWVNKKLLEDLFTPTIAQIVDGVTKVSAELEGISKEEAREWTINKFLRDAMKEPRSICVKLADRVDNIKSIHGIKDPKRRVRIAKETLTYYVPLAGLLSMYEVKDYLEERCFEIIQVDGNLHDLEEIKKEKKRLYDDNPEIMNFVNKASQVDLETKTNFFVDVLKTDPKIKLVTSNISANVDYKFKTYPQIKEKLDHLKNTFGNGQISLEDVHDLFKFKVNLSSIEDCYRAKKAFESFIAEGDSDLFFGEPFYVKDYIQKPAFNGYQAIHARYLVKSINLKIQIEFRTFEMKKRAMDGIASCWNYDYIDAKNDMLEYLKKKPFYEDLKDLCNIYYENISKKNANRSQIEKEFHQGLYDWVYKKRIKVRLNDEEYQVRSECTLAEFLFKVHPEFIEDGSIFVTNGGIILIDEKLYDEIIIKRIAPQKEESFERTLKRRDI